MRNAEGLFARCKESAPDERQYVSAELISINLS